MIKRLRVAGYKSLRDVEVNFGHELAVLFGPNTAGKSNVLDALQLLSRMCTCKTLNMSFEPPYRGTPLESFSFPEQGIAGLMAGGQASFWMEIDVELSEDVVRSVEAQIEEMRRGVETSKDKNKVRISERYLRYRLEVEILTATGVLRVKEESLMVLTPESQPSLRRKPFLSKEPDGQLHLRREGGKHPFHFEGMLDHTVVSQPHYPPYFPHLTAFREELSRWSFFYFEPRTAMRAANPIKEVRHIRQMGEDLAAYLNTLRAKEPRRFDGIRRAIHTLIPSITDIEVEASAVGEVELRVREGSVSVPARVVSEGTLRMLGLLSLKGAAVAPTLIGFEEGTDQTAGHFAGPGTRRHRSKNGVHSGEPADGLSAHRPEVVRGCRSTSLAKNRG